MRPKVIIKLLAVALLGLLFIGSACRRGGARSSAETGAPKSEQIIAKSDATPDPRAFEAKLGDNGGEGVDFPEREEIRRSYNLKPGALVNIHGINGRVTVQTANTNVAEVLIVRSAKKREDLEYRKINIEHEPDKLVISVEGDRKSIFSSLGFIPEGRQRVILRLPRKVDFETNGVNGDVTVSEVLGRVEIRGTNGKVKVDQAAGETEVSGVNGGIDVTFAQGFGEKAEVRGVNGNIDLQFVGEANANLNAWGINGNIDADLPRVERQESEPRRGRMKARIGNGGAVIEIHGVNGNVHLMKADLNAKFAKEENAKHTK